MSIKRLIVVLFIGGAIVTACSSSKSMHAQTVIDRYGKDEQLADTFLRALQQRNDLVLAAAVELTAWGHNIAYQIIAQKNGQWTGYIYKMTAARGGQVQVTEVNVAAKECDNLLPYFEKEVLWKEKTEDRSKCNTAINDGSTWQLLLITPSKVLRSSYYEPEFYQQHCPDSTRQVFLDATNKLKTLFAENPVR